jgi:hypothetical protein
LRGKTTLSDLLVLEALKCCSHLPILNLAGKLNCSFGQSGSSRPPIEAAAIPNGDLRVENVIFNDFQCDFQCDLEDAMTPSPVIMGHDCGLVELPRSSSRGEGDGDGDGDGRWNCAVHCTVGSQGASILTKLPPF